MRRPILFAAAVALLVPANASATERYLTGDSVALMAVLPPAPVTGSAADTADRVTFRETRALVGTPRWTQAIGDVDEHVPAMLADFSVAAGRPLSVESTPVLAQLLARMRGDVAAAVNAVKPLYARRRPFLIDAGAVCQPVATLASSFDYPSGHTGWGTAVALVLAELIPSRADAILARGRDYGESRIVCGAHNASAVAAGRIAAAAVVARLHADPAFRSDLNAARHELDGAAAIMAAIADPAGRSIVIAHRGCHAAAPGHGLSDAPENSLLALDHCVAIGIDVMETDVRMTRDGHLVMIHDATVDRTTNGVGRVADLTLAEIRALRLRADLGGATAAITELTVPTLTEMLAHADGRIVLNLDIKDAVHAETIEAVLRADASGRVLVKATAGIASPPLAGIAPFDAVPFLPMLSAGSASATDLSAIIARQATARHRPVGYEVPRMPLAALPATVAAARAARGRLWANTLWDGYIADVGGDAVAAERPDAVWGRLIHAGVSMLQTDRPGDLRTYLDRPAKH